MIITGGATNKSIYVYFVDDDSGTAPGEPTTGLLFSDIETGGSASYCRQGAARVDFTLVTLANAAAAHSDGGFILVDNTNMPGVYRLDIPDLAIATGVDLVIVQLVAASGKNTVMRPVWIDLTVDLRDTVRLGLTALPGAAADAAGGLPISIAGSLDLDARLDAAVSSRVAPTVAGRTIDLTAGGAAGVDWGNVENKATVNDLSGTDIQLCDTVTINTDMVGTDNAALASVVGALADAAVDGDPTATDTLIAYVKQLINILIGTTGIVAFPAEAAPANAVSLAEVIRAIAVDVTGLAGSAMRGTDSAALATALSTAQADLDTLTGADGAIIASSQTVATVTTLTNLPSIPANWLTAAGIAASALNGKGDWNIGKTEYSLSAVGITAVWQRQMTEGYAADGVAPTPEEMLFMLHSEVSEFAIAGTTVTSKKLDGSTAAMTHTLDDASNPTSRTRAS